MRLGEDAMLAEEPAAHVAPAGTVAAGTLGAGAAQAAAQRPPKAGQRQFWASKPSFGKPRASSKAPASAAASGEAKEPASPTRPQDSHPTAAAALYAGRDDGAADAAETSEGCHSSAAVRSTDERAGPSDHGRMVSGSQQVAAATEQLAEACAAHPAAAAAAEDKGKGVAPPASTITVEDDTKALFAALLGMPMDED